MHVIFISGEAIIDIAIDSADARLKNRPWFSLCNTKHIYICRGITAGRLAPKLSDWVILSEQGIRRPPKACNQFIRATNQFIPWQIGDLPHAYVSQHTVQKTSICAEE